MESYKETLYILAKKEHELTELEHLMFQLDIILDGKICANHQIIQQLTFKSPNTYLTNDGLLLNSFCWYLRCVIYGSPVVLISGKTIEDCIKNTIQLYSDCQNDRDNSSKIIKSFLEKQRKFNLDSLNIRSI